MIKLRFFSLLLSVSILMTVFPVSTTAAQSDFAVTNGCHSVDAAMTLSSDEKLTDTAKAAVLYELNSGTMLYSYHSDEKVFPTSMVKMMTTLVALENGDLDDKVTVTRSVLNQLPIGIVSSGLKAGEVISLRDLLYCTMVESANDAAVVVANHIAESTELFVQMMNEKAAELGCSGTNYSNVHGLHDDNTYTTARDVARLTEAALKNETFRTMFETVTYMVPATNKCPERKITTTNHMMNENNRMYYDPLVTGGKTGATDQGGRCLAMTAEKNGMRILCIVMGATPVKAADGSIVVHGHFEESKVLMDYAFKNFEFRQVFFAGQSLEQYPVNQGANDVVAQTVESISTILPIEMDETQLRWVYKPIHSVMNAPVTQGQNLGIVEAWYSDKCLAQTEMVAMNAVNVFQAPTVPEKPKTSNSGSWLMLLLVLAGLVLVAFLVILGMRIVGILRYQRRMKRRRGQKR